MASPEEYLSTRYNNVVLDIGAGVWKGGVAGADAPSVVFPAFVGRPLHPSVIIGMGGKERYVGDEARAKRGMLDLVYPNEHGTIINWDDLEALLHHTLYDQLRVDPTERAVLIADAVLTPAAQRQRLAQVLFETLPVSAVYFAEAPALDLYAAGRTSGAVLDCGDGVCQVGVIYEGLAIRDAVCRLDLGGRDLTKCLAGILPRPFSTSAECDVVRDIKERLGYVALDFDSELAAAAQGQRGMEQKYELPDGAPLHIGEQRFRCTEPLFRPQLLDHACASVHEAAGCVQRRHAVRVGRALGRVPEHRPRWWQHHVRRVCRASEQRADAAGAARGQAQGCGAARTQILHVDRWLHSGVALLLPVDVD